MSFGSRRPRRLVGGFIAAAALALVPATTFTAAQAAEVPAPASNLRVVTNPVTPSGDLRVIWNASPSANVTEYQIEVRTDPWGGTSIDYVGTDERDYTITGLEPGQAVEIQVRALASDEDSEELSAPIRLVANTLGEGEKLSFLDTVRNTFSYEIAWLSSTGITTGYTDNTFRPGQPVLREQMAAFLFRIFNSDGQLEDYPAPQFSRFTDVPTTHTFYREISWLADSGISTGYANGDGTRSFAPSAPVLREQMAAFLYRAFDDEYSHGLDPASFTDVPRRSTFYNEIEWLALVNITTGYREANGTLTFRGAQPVLREQMAAFLYRSAGVYYQYDWEFASAEEADKLGTPPETAPALEN